jgi:drug/metabolite transporter (DMT)-like permease
VTTQHATRNTQLSSVPAATISLLLAALGFGSVVILTKLARDGGAPLASILAWRYAIAAALLVGLSGGVRAVRLPPRRALPILLLGGGGQAAIAFLSLRALDYIPAAAVGFLFYTYPAWVALGAAATGAERLTGARAAALALSLAGIALMVGAPGAAALHRTGVALALGSAAIYAVFIPVVGRLQRGTPPAVASTYIVAGVTVVALVIGAAGDDITVALAPRVWAAIAALALFSTALAFIYFLRGLAVLGPVRTSIISTVEPFWTALAGMLVLGQPLRGSTLAGGALIAAAVLLLQWREGGRQGFIQKDGAAGHQAETVS